MCFRLLPDFNPSSVAYLISGFKQVGAQYPQNAATGARTFDMKVLMATARLVNCTDLPFQAIEDYFDWAVRLKTIV